MLKNPSDFPWGTLLIAAGVGAVLYFWYEGSQNGHTNPISAIGSGLSSAVNSVQSDLQLVLGGAGLGAGGYLGYKAYNAFANNAASSASSAASDAASATAGDTYNIFGDMYNNLSTGLSDLGHGLEDILNTMGDTL